MIYLLLLILPMKYGMTQNRSEDIEYLTKKWNSRLHNSRYMTSKEGCDTLLTYPEWENLPVIKCTYSVAGFKATVIMLNPTTKQIATWIVNACYETGHGNVTSMDKVFAHIINQSGGQFPLAGIVLEDMDGNGKPSNYCFRNGVTVSIKGLFLGSTRFPEKQATQEEIEKSLNGEVEGVYKYARIQSTSREDYIRYSKKAMTTAKGNKWMDVVAKLYKEAWNSDHNDLLTAWVKAHL
jgi:hypothetical protein